MMFPSIPRVSGAACSGARRYLASTTSIRVPGATRLAWSSAKGGVSSPLLDGTTSIDCSLRPGGAYRSSLAFASRVTRNVQVRTFALMPEDALKKRLDDFQDLFVEARLCIEDARDSEETTYFAEDLDAAQEAVDEAVSAFDTIVGDLDDKDQKNSVLRGNGLKVEQLKGELKMIIDGHGHHH